MVIIGKGGNRKRKVTGWADKRPMIFAKNMSY